MGANLTLVLRNWKLSLTKTRIVIYVYTYFVRPETSTNPNLCSRVPNNSNNFRVQIQIQAIFIVILGIYIVYLRD